ncbi:unnamed protein product [Vicia faba]|uniref:Reverse transcriptase zinc-binding domain-containing protein n=1 Tax=Vicia faba TaxID=3906 RepID=A0AAV0YWJ8_VICFA|nr:unnamed protein product [Vicia faba]
MARGPTLNLLFPTLFGLTSRPMGRVCDMGAFHEQVWSWDFQVEAEAVLEAFDLVNLLAGTNPIAEGIDSIKWWQNADDIFSVKRCLSFMRDKLLDEVVEPNRLAAIKRFWRTEIPSKIKIFRWRIMLNRLSSKDQLAKRSIIVSDQDKVCVFCSADFEDLEHLFFKCSFFKRVWDSIYMWLNLQNLEEAVGSNHLDQFVRALGGKIRKKKICLV